MFADLLRSIEYVNPKRNYSSEGSSGYAVLLFGQIDLSCVAGLW